MTVPGLCEGVPWYRGKLLQVEGLANETDRNIIQLEIEEIPGVKLNIS